MPAKKNLIDDAVVPDDVTLPAAPSGNRVVTAENLAADRKFLASLDAHGAIEADKPEATVTEDPEPVEGEAVDAPPVTVAAVAPVRGGVNALVTRLLADPDLSYTDIVTQVAAAFPGAQTTARSVASTASVLRRKGVTVPMRRGPKA